MYPDWFAGDWMVTTTLVDMVAPLAPEVVTPGFEGNRRFLNQPIAFRVRFIETKPPGLQSFIQPLLQPLFENKPAEVVSDRAYNGTNLAKAYLGDRAVLAVKVDPSNPNRQVTLFSDNRQLASTVTARATEAPTPDQFVTTEIFQQEFLGAPQIYFNEVENTTAYMHKRGSSESLNGQLSRTPINPLDATLALNSSEQHDETLDDPDLDAPEITADQVTAIYLSPQDPDYFKTFPDDNLLADPYPVALYRYRMEFRKIDE